MNTVKTEELIVDFMKKDVNIHSSSLGLETVYVERDFHFLEVTIREDLTWGIHTADVVKATKGTKDNNIPERLLVSFYCCTVENILINRLCE